MTRHKYEKPPPKPREKKVREPNKRVRLRDPRVSRVARLRTLWYEMERSLHKYGRLYVLAMERDRPAKAEGYLKEVERLKEVRAELIKSFEADGEHAPTHVGD